MESFPNIQSSRKKIDITISLFLYPIRSMSVYLFKGIEVILLLLCRFVVFIEINGICEPLAIEDMGSGIGRKIIFIGATDRNG
jgi:hypothetical protein